MTDNWRRRSIFIVNQRLLVASYRITFGGALDLHLQSWPRSWDNRPLKQHSKYVLKDSVLICECSSLVFSEVSRNPGLYRIPSRRSDLYPGRRTSWSRTLLLSGRHLSRDLLSSMHDYYRMIQGQRSIRLCPPHPWCFLWREHRRHRNAASREPVSRSWACKESTPRSLLPLTSSRMWSCVKVSNL